MCGQAIHQPPIIHGGHPRPAEFHPTPTYVSTWNHVIPNDMIDACPPFTPQSYQTWRMGIKLWLAAQAGATVTRLIAKIITALPLNSRLGDITYT